MPQGNENEVKLADPKEQRAIKAAHDNPHLVEVPSDLAANKPGKRTYVTLATVEGLDQLKKSGALTNDAYVAIRSKLPLGIANTGRYVVLLEGTGTDDVQAVRAFSAVEIGTVVAGSAVRSGEAQPVSRNGRNYALDNTLRHCC
jgi:hypothetical protein